MTSPGQDGDKIFSFIDTLLEEESRVVPSKVGCSSPAEHLSKSRLEESPTGPSISPIFCSEDREIPRLDNPTLDWAPMPVSGETVLCDTNNCVSVGRVKRQFRPVFESRFKSFNQMQSHCFEDVYCRDENLVVSAPTASGKTVLFELAIVRLLEKHAEFPDIVAKEKMVYISPLKSLCSQIEREWKARFANAGASVLLYTSDNTDQALMPLEHYDLIITTPEKWDFVTRKWREFTVFFDKLGLIMVDEVHLVGEGKRGATLEVVITRMKTIQRELDKDTRIIAVSATISNIQDFCTWLSNNYQAPALPKSFDQSYRPSGLTLRVYGYNRRRQNDYIFSRSLDDKVFAVYKQHCWWKSTLVFCTTKKETEDCAKIFLTELLKCMIPKAAHDHSFDDDFRLSSHGNPTFIVSKENMPMANTLATQLCNESLRSLVSFGIAFHHAGLSTKDRQLIEDAYRNKVVTVMFATTTLATGMDLPVHAVIIKSTLHYSDGGWTEYSNATILQMLGRAGRDPTQKGACAIILTEDKNEAHYRQRALSLEHINSQLAENLLEHINAEIVLSGSEPALKYMEKWFTATFFYVRACKSPITYGIEVNGENDIFDTDIASTTHDAVIHFYFHKLLYPSLTRLKSLEMIDTFEDDENFSQVNTNNFGKIMSEYYLQHETMGAFKNVNTFFTTIDLLTLFCSLNEFSEIRLKVEKKKFTDRRKSEEFPLKYQLRPGVNLDMLKINTIAQSVLSEYSVHELASQQDVNLIFKALNRVSTAFYKYVLALIDNNSGKEQSLGKIRKECLLLMKSLQKRRWFDAHFLSQHLKVWTTRTQTALHAKNIRTVDDFNAASNLDLEKVLGLSSGSIEALRRKLASNAVHYSLEVNLMRKDMPPRKGVVLDETWMSKPREKYFKYANDALNSPGLILQEISSVSKGDQLILVIKLQGLLPPGPETQKKLNIAKEAHLFIFNEHNEEVFTAKADGISNNGSLKLRLNPDPSVIGRVLKVCLVHKDLLGVDITALLFLSYSAYGHNDPIFLQSQTCSAHNSDLDRYLAFQEQYYSIKSRKEGRKKLPSNPPKIESHAINVAPALQTKLSWMGKETNLDGEPDSNHSDALDRLFVSFRDREKKKKIRLDKTRDKEILPLNNSNNEPHTAPSPRYFCNEQDQPDYFEGSMNPTLKDTRLKVSKKAFLNLDPGPYCYEGNEMPYPLSLHRSVQFDSSCPEIDKSTDIDVSFLAGVSTSKNTASAYIDEELDMIFENWDEIFSANNNDQGPSINARPTSLKSPNFKHARTSSITNSMKNKVVIKQEKICDKTEMDRCRPTNILSKSAQNRFELVTPLANHHRTPFSNLQETPRYTQRFYDYAERSALPSILNESD